MSIPTTCIKQSRNRFPTITSLDTPISLNNTIFICSGNSLRLDNLIKLKNNSQNDYVGNDKQIFVVFIIFTKTIQVKQQDNL